ncbi:hypothetical protein CHUAL_007135 [Chamberlinius hualienensis]
MSLGRVTLSGIELSRSNVNAVYIIVGKLMLDVFNETDKELKSDRICLDKRKVMYSVINDDQFITEHIIADILFIRLFKRFHGCCFFFWLRSCVHGHRHKIQRYMYVVSSAAPSVSSINPLPSFAFFQGLSFSVAMRFVNHVFSRDVETFVK